jgi:hypothetical protein
VYTTVGDEYPEAEIVGIDLSPIQPSWVPPNVRFIVDDAEDEWPYRAGSFDFVHARHVCMAIKDWPRLVQQAHASLRPGAWLELQEIRFVVLCDDGSVPPGYGYGRFTDLMCDGFAKFNLFPRQMERNAALLRDGGFVGVQEQVFKLPIGTWPRDANMRAVGLYCRTMLVDALQGMAMATLTRGMGWTPQEVELFLVDVRRSLMDSSIHSYLTFHIVTGQKPY